MTILAPLTFALLQRGMTARVIAVDEDCAESRRLQEMGLTIGTQFRVMKVAPLGDPVEIDVRGYRLCIRKRECACIEIESVD